MTSTIIPTKNSTFTLKLLAKDPSADVSGKTFKVEDTVSGMFDNRGFSGNPDRSIDALAITGNWAAKNYLSRMKSLDEKTRPADYLDVNNTYYGHVDVNGTSKGFIVHQSELTGA